MLLLQRHAAQIVDRTHQAHAHAGPEHIHDRAAGRLFEMRAGEVQLRIAADQIHCAQHGADALRQHRGYSGTAHAHAQRPHKGGVQPDIQHTAEQKKQKRCNAVAHSAQQGGLHIVEHRQRDAQQNYGQVGSCAVPHLGRNLQHLQQRTASQQRHCGQHYRHRRRKGDHPADGAADALPLPCPKAAADRQCQTIVHAEGKVHDQPVQCGSSADLRQSGGAKQMPAKAVSVRL